MIVLESKFHIITMDWMAIVCPSSGLITVDKDAV